MKGGEGNRSSDVVMDGSVAKRTDLEVVDSNVDIVKPTYTREREREFLGGATTIFLIVVQGLFFNRRTFHDFDELMYSPTRSHQKTFQTHAILTKKRLPF